MNCPICQSAPAEGVSWQAPHVRVLKCASCGHLYAADPAPGQGMPPMTDPVAERRKYAEQDARLVRRWIRDRFLYDGVRILDVGAGNGRVSEAIRSAVPGAQVFCMEPEPRAQAYLRSRGFDVVTSFTDVERVDAVLLIEVIEHVDDPVGLLRSCRDVLDDSGTLFLTTPCGETAKGHRPMEPYLITEHIQFFTEESLRLACDLAGFSDMKFIGPDVMHPRDPGLRYAISLAKTAIRPLRDAVTGRQRLICYVD